MTVVSSNCAAIIKHFEGLELKAYPDAGSSLGKEMAKHHIAAHAYKSILNWQSFDGAPWTIGYGTTSATGHQVHEGLEINEATAVVWLMEHLNRVAMQVTAIVKVPINQNQLDALVSFAYNNGIGALKGSRLLKKLNDSKYEAAADEFLRWRVAGGVVLPDLEKRRILERALFKDPT